jgi:very-short-patch-repair endonuclease
MADKRAMFYGSKGDLFANARQLRNHETESEKELWARLSKSQLHGYRFKRQHPISKYIADFYCHRVKLVIEVDGGYHETNDQRMYDKRRTQALNELGIKVLRFTNRDVTERLDWVVQEIEKWLPMGTPK